MYGRQKKTSPLPDQNNTCFKYNTTLFRFTYKG